MNADKLLAFAVDKILFLPATLIKGVGLPKPIKFFVLLFNCSIWALLTTPLWCPLMLAGLFWAFYDEA